MRKSVLKVTCVGHHGDRLAIALGLCHGPAEADRSAGARTIELAVGLESG